MKTSKIFNIISLFLLISLTVSAQNKSSENISISGTRFTYPLIEKWISEYSRINPEVHIQIVPKASDPNPINLKVIAHTPSSEEFAGGQKLFLVSRYALLPVVKNINPLLANARKNALNKEELDKLFFEEDIFTDNSAKKEKTYNNLNIYSREGQACATIAFAEHFGHKPADIKGKKISGDDIYLLTAVQKDSLGITFNNLGYIYDIQTRKIKEGLSILPVELKKEANGVLNGDMDQVIQVLETNTFETVPVEKIGFVFNSNAISGELKNFLKWIVTEGQKYNHDYGFLNLDKETLSNQMDLLDNKYLTSRN